MSNFYFKTILNSDKNIDKMDKNFISRFNSMCLEFKNKTGKEIIVTRTFTTKEEQDNLYKKSLKDKNTIKNNPYPQTLHCQGRAIDILPNFTNMLENMGLLEKYGFIAPFNKERRHIQNINENSDLYNAGDGLLFKEVITSKGGDTLNSVDEYIRNNLSRDIPKDIIKKSMDRNWASLRFTPEILGGVDKKYLFKIDKLKNYIEDFNNVKKAVDEGKITEEKAVQGLKEVYSLQEGTTFYHDEAKNKSTSFTGKKDTLKYINENKEKYRNKQISEIIGSIEQLKTRGGDLITMAKSITSEKDAKELENKTRDLRNDIIKTIEKNLNVKYLDVNEKGVWSFKDNITGETFEFSQSGIEKAKQSVKSNSFSTLLGIAGGLAGTLLGPAGTIGGGMLGTYLGSFLDTYSSANILGRNITLSEANEIAKDVATVDGVVNAITFGTGKLLKHSLKPFISVGKPVKSLYNFSKNYIAKPFSNVFNKVKDVVKKPFEKISKKTPKKVSKTPTTKTPITKTKPLPKAKPVSSTIKSIGGLSIKKLATLALKTSDKSINDKSDKNKKTTMTPITSNGKVYYIWAGDIGKDYKKLIKEKNIKEYKIEKDTDYSSLKDIEVDVKDVYKKPIVNKKLENLYHKDIENDSENIDNNDFKNIDTRGRLIKNVDNNLNVENTIKNQNIENKDIGVIENKDNFKIIEPSFKKNIDTDKLKNNDIVNTNNNTSDAYSDINFNENNINILNSGESSKNKNEFAYVDNKINIKENSKLIKEFNL